MKTNKFISIFIFSLLVILIASPIFANYEFVEYDFALYRNVAIMKVIRNFLILLYIITSVTLFLILFFKHQKINEDKKLKHDYIIFTLITLTIIFCLSISIVFLCNSKNYNKDYFEHPNPHRNIFEVIEPM